MIVYLIRHPRPCIDAGQCYGRLDIPAENAETVAMQLRGHLPAEAPVYSSPLQRCRQLAVCLHPAPGIDARLAEMHFGDWEGRDWSAIPRHELDAWAADVAGFVPPGGESAGQVQQRAVAFLDEQVRRGHSALVVVTHAGVIRLLQAWHDQRPIAEVLDDRPDYGSVRRLVWSVAASAGQ